MKHNRHIDVFTLLFALMSMIVVSSCNQNQGKVKTTEPEKPPLWTCSMHPEIIRDHPGECPICGMTLIKKVEKASALRGISLDDLLQPTDQYVLSSIPVTTISKKTLPMATEAYGSVTYDTRLVSTISARISGRIVKTYVHYRFQHVHTGEHILDIYSPEIATAEQELLFLYKNDPENIALINAGKQRLLLLGMSSNQLQQVLKSGKASSTIAIYSNQTGHLHDAGNTMPEISSPGEKMDNTVIPELSVKEGMYVEKGQTIFQLFDTEKSWVILNIFPESQSMIKVGNPVQIIPETAPAKTFRAKIDFIEPFFRKENKTLTARIYFDNSTRELPVGSQVRARIFIQAVTGDWLPKSAVLSLGKDKIVFVQTAGGFQAHKVQTGTSINDQIQINEGLSDSTAVAINAQFLADSESFIKVNSHL